MWCSHASSTQDSGYSVHISSVSVDSMCKDTSSFNLSCHNSFKHDFSIKGQGARDKVSMSHQMLSSFPDNWN